MTIHSQLFNKVAVIDVGSNTIKMLIAGKCDQQGIKVEDFFVEETRIGEGMTGDPPVIDAGAIERGARSIKILLDNAPDVDALCVVATSAVRDASNKQEFVNAVKRACGQELRILSGEEEAGLISIGLQYDPSVADLLSFTLLDLGGGSMECIQFIDRKVTCSQSLQLGSVRLASLLVENRDQPLGEHDRVSIESHVRKAWRQSEFDEGSSPSDTAVLTGGSAGLILELFGNQEWDFKTFQDYRKQICAADLSTRIAQHSIPAARADIFPTALVSFETTLRYLGCNRIRLSRYNLRHGLAASLFEHGFISI